MFDEFIQSPRNMIMHTITVMIYFNGMAVFWAVWTGKIATFQKNFVCKSLPWEKKMAV